MCNSNKTVKLYDIDAYATEFEATVLSCEEIQKDGETSYKIILDKTLFFPEEGGQTPDKGMIDGINVLDVRIQKDIISHFLPEPVREGTQISGKIDWNHRFSNMQQHSGEHIFSGIVSREYHLNNVGFHLSDNIVSMDYDGVLTAEQIEDIEWKANQAIIENIEIDTRYPDKTTLSKLEYRSKIEIDGPVRIVTIPGYDVCACCAPHVKRTGEIGMLKVMSVQNYKGGVRLTILCGFRALQEYREKNKIISSLTNLFSTSQDTLLERAQQLKNTNQEIKLQLGVLKQDEILGKIEMISEEQKNVILFEENLETAIMRNVVNVLVKQHNGICAVFVGNDADGYQFILGSSALDCKEIADRMRSDFGAKCGGSRSMIQGSVMARNIQIMRLFNAD